MKYNNIETIKIENFSIMKSEEDNDIGLFFNFKADWEIQSHSEVSYDKEKKTIFLKVEHDDAVSKFEFSGFENKLVHNIAFEKMTEYINENILSFFCVDNEKNESFKFPTVTKV